MSFASAVVLNDRERFRNYFRTLPTNINLPSSLITIVKHFGWRQMAVISEDQNLFTGVRVCSTNSERYLNHEVYILKMHY